MPNSGGFRSLVGRHVGGLAGQSGFVPNSGGFRSLFGRQVFGLNGSTSPPPPPPPPTARATGGKWSQDPFRRARAPKKEEPPEAVTIQTGVVSDGVPQIIVTPVKAANLDTEDAQRMLRRIRRSRRNAERDAEDDDDWLLLF